MIRYYTYYNCGGYKDMYIGTDSMNVDATYFVPLLPVWKNRNRLEDSEKIARAESVTQIELMTNTMSCGFPNECTVLFTHAGYKTIYMTLQDGNACFCIRDIEEHGRDEENRKTPFNFLFIAEGEESIKKLDTLALSYLDDSDKVEDIIRKSISYTPIINAIKFSLHSLESLFNDGGYLGINHIAGRVAYLKTYNIQIALNELSIDANDVDVFYDGNNNILKGKLLSYSYEEPLTDIKESDVVSADGIAKSSENEKTISAEPNDKVENVGIEQQNVSVTENTLDVPKVCEMNEVNVDVKDISQKISAISKDIDALKEQIYALFKIVGENFSYLESLINDDKNSDVGKHRLVKLISGKLLTEAFSKQMIKYLLILMVGVVIGIILF